jgi:C-terminal processing protease CtpA/Prc
MLAPASTAYTKPLMMLVDEFSASGADMLPAIIQDNRRGPLFGRGPGEVVCRADLGFE